LASSLLKKSRKLRTSRRARHTGPVSFVALLAKATDIALEVCLVTDPVWRAEQTRLFQQAARWGAAAERICGRFFRGALVSLLPMVLAGCVEEAEERTPALDGQLRLGSVLGESALDGFARADTARDFSFPRDHGPHPRFRSEWWYLTMVLADSAGRDLGVQFTLFRQALAPEPSESDNRWLTPQVYLAHFAVTDGAAGRHREAERFARGHPELAGVQQDPFSLWLEDWRLETVPDGWRLSATMAGAGVDLQLAVPVPVVLQGEAGLSRKGPDQASYYYSMPRIPVTGVVEFEDSVRRVQGLGWLDREWSTSMLSDGQQGWDWFALQLDDGRSLMVFQLRRRDGGRDPYDQGMLVDAQGRSRHLTAADFRLTPIEVWRDDEGTEWPVVWRIDVADESWWVEPVVADQRMDTSVSYWEGMVVVRDAAGERLGRGYLELTGYERDARTYRSDDDG